MTVIAPNRDRGPRVRTAVVVALIGLLAAVPGIVGVVHTFGDVLSSPAYQVPATLRLDLGSGDYTIYQRSGTRDSYGPLTVTRGADVELTPADVQITAPDGSDVPVAPRAANETITTGTTEYVSALRFRADRAGRYTIRIESPAPTAVKVQRPLVAQLRRSLPWLGLVGLGGLLVVTGTVLFVVGALRRNADRRRAAVVATAPPLPPAAWYPDPDGRHRWRWWDGHTWTSHTSD